jgi:hypothetical protein
MKTLITYFSAQGTTAKVAKELAAMTGADIFEIRPEKPYTAADLKWTKPLARCNCDFPGIDFIHVGLVSPRTVSNGDDRCDNWIVSADSDAVQKYPPERRENGLLISRDWREEKS